MLTSALLWLHDTVNSIWSSWLTSYTHTVFLSTECSPSLKTWSAKKSIVYWKAFHYLTEFLYLIFSPWSSLCCFYLFNEIVWNLKFGVFSREWGAKLHCTGWLQLAVALVSSVVALLGQPAALCHVDTARFFSAALLEFGASPLAEDWYSLVSHSTLGRQTHCHNRDVKFNEKKKRKILILKSDVPCLRPQNYFLAFNYGLM